MWIKSNQLSWTDFAAPWETDVKAGFYWLQAALNLPLSPGSREYVTELLQLIESLAETG